jgi:hypothetical protein
VTTSQLADMAEGRKVLDVVGWPAGFSWCSESYVLKRGRIGSASPFRAAQYRRHDEQAAVRMNDTVT